jgi:hypothetical protein
VQTFAGDVQTTFLPEDLPNNGRKCCRSPQLPDKWRNMSDNGLSADIVKASFWHFRDKCFNFTISLSNRVSIEVKCMKYDNWTIVHICIYAYMYDMHICISCICKFTYETYMQVLVL